MIPAWKQILRCNFIHLEKLADFLELDSHQREQLLPQASFPLNLPLRLAQKIQKGTLDDPILRQFIPFKKEREVVPGFVLDPVQDQQAAQHPKLLQKYQGRVLLLVTSACAMNCRYCFRQNYDYEVQEKTYSRELQSIAQDSTIHEVILSGGDPLSLSDSSLQSLLQAIAEIPHIKRIRFHSRFPVGIPERIDSSFLSILEKIPVQFWFVLHSNHPSEFDADIFAALKSLQKLGIPVLNQSVLLKGVNDTADILQQHCELLVDHGITPYYLHQLDRVQGAAHFEVPESEGHILMQELTKRLAGYAIPKYVREIAGEPSKTPL